MDTKLKDYIVLTDFKRQARIERKLRKLRPMLSAGALEALVSKATARVGGR